jgi:heptosyltransferase-1
VKILILKPSSLGDIIHALPVLRLLKKHWPHSSIFWWVDSGLAPLLENDPDLAGIFRFQRRRWGRLSGFPSMLKAILALRRERFDLVIDLQGLARSGAFAWLANGTFTVGVDDPREGAAGFYDLAVPRPGAAVHAADWYLEVLRQLRVPTGDNFVWLPKRTAAAAELEKTIGLSQNEWILLNPGARWANKRWSPPAFGEVLLALAAERPGARFAVLGGHEDVLLGEQIVRYAPDRAVSLAGKTSLSELIELIRAARLIITNDTGPMHIAAATGTPMAALFGPTDPRRTGPYGMESSVLRLPLPCSPCLSQTCRNRVSMECLHALHPGMVLAAARKKLAVLG